MGQGADAFFNLVTIIFVTLTVVVGIVVIGVAAEAMEPPILAPGPTATLPPVLDMPTLTPSFTPLPPTETPTYTPSPTFTPSLTPTATDTPLPTSTGTAGPTPTFTPGPSGTATTRATSTLTLTPSPTSTFTPSPTGPTPTQTNTLSPYPFAMQEGSPRMRTNFANAAGCSWQGLAGQVITQTNEPITGVQIRVSGQELSSPLVTLSGSSTVYGPSGWEIVVDNKTNNNSYTVSLWSGDIQVSPEVEVVFPNSCEQNLAMINFLQTRPY